MAIPAWQKAYLNQPTTPKPSFQLGSQPQSKYVPPQGLQAASSGLQPMAAQPTDTSWMDKLTLYSTDPNAAKTEYQRANQVFNAKTAIGDTAGAAGAKTWMGQVDTSSGGMAVPKPNDELEPWMKAYADNLNKPITPFKYDAQSDPSYQSQKAIIGEDLRKASANAKVEAGAVGMRGGSLQNNQLSQLAQQSESRLQNEVIPGLRNQSYGEYKDAIQQDRNKNLDSMAWINTKYGMNKDEAESKRTAITDANAAEDRTYTNQLRGEATQDRHIKLAHDQEVKYGVPIKPTDQYSETLAQTEGLKTVAQQKQEADAQKATYDNAWNQFKEIGRVTAELAPILGLPEGTTTQQARYQNATLNNSQRNADTDNKLAQAKFDYEKDPTNPDNLYKNQQIEKAKSELDQIGKAKPITIQDAQSVLLKTPFITDETITDRSGAVQKTGKTKIDKPGLVQAIGGLGVSANFTDEQMSALFALNGITDEEVEAISKQLDDERKARASRGNQ